MVSSRNTTITAIRILYLLLLCVLQAQVRLCFAAKVWLLLPHFICLRNLWIFFPLISFYWVHMKVYVVYLGSRGSDDPDEILRQNHQILTDIHGGRFKIKTHLSFPPFSIVLVPLNLNPDFPNFLVVVLMLLLCSSCSCCSSLFVLIQNHSIGSVYSGEEAKESHVYSYRHGFRGFAAKLTEDQASF